MSIASISMASKTTATVPTDEERAALVRSYAGLLAGVHRVG